MCLSNITHYYKAATNGLPIKLVEYSASSKKLLIRLEDSVTRSQLEALVVDFDKLQATDKTGKVKGVIVTLASDGVS